MILLDTNTLVHYIRGIEPVARRLRAASPRDLRMPSVVAYELEYGALRSGSPHRRKMTTELLRGIVQIPFDHAAASEAVRIRINLEERALVIGPLDLMIAGTATSRGALLVTSNGKEFSRVKGLRLADWTQ